MIAARLGSRNAFRRVEMGIDPEDLTEARAAVDKKRFREASALAMPVSASQG